MKTLVTLATLLFWMAVGGTQLMAASSAPGSGAPPAAATATYTLAEVARHATAQSCWMAIDGVVYDFTAYLPRHPADPKVILAWCGKEASEAFRTKGVGRPHSGYAREQLAGYRQGLLKK